MKTYKIKDYINHTFIKYATNIIVLILIVYFLSLLFLFKTSIVDPAYQNNKEIIEVIDEDFEKIRSKINELSNNEELQTFLLNHQNTNVQVTRELFDFIHNRKLSTKFVLIDANLNIKSTNLLKSEKESFVDSHFIKNIIENIQQNELIEQTIGKLDVFNNNYSTYYFVKNISLQNQNLGYIIFFVNPSNINYNNQMIFITDEYDNIIYNTHHLAIDTLGKLNLDTSNRFIEINRNMYYLTKRTSMENEIHVYTLTSINTYRFLLIYGFISMLITSLIIILVVRMVTPKLLKNSLEPFEELVSFISNQNKNMVVENNFDEVKTIYEEFNSKINEIKNLIKINQEITENKKLIEIKNLESKFNPHFLYNVLEMIKYEIDFNPKNASNMIVKVSKLLRYNSSSTSKPVPLGDDLEYLNDYFTLQKMRYGERLSYVIDIPNNHKKQMIPKLMIQPLIENAIKYNINNVEKLKVEVKSRVYRDNFYITVKDDGLGISRDKLKEINRILRNPSDESIHTGIKNIQKLIKLLYGEDYGLSISSELEKGTHIKIKLPLYFYKKEDEPND